MAIMKYLTAKLVLIFTALCCVLGANPCNVRIERGFLTANCQNTQLNYIPRNLGGTLKILRFQNNRLTRIDDTDLAFYPHLQEINFENNQISFITPQSFRQLGNLYKLNLGGNELTEIPKGAFQNINKLRYLILQNNPIKHIGEDLLVLPRLEKLLLDNCEIESITPTAFKLLGISMTELDLSDNKLTHLDAELRDSFTNSLRTLRLFGNPWYCDCNLRWLRNWVTLPGIAWEFGTYVPKCTQPERLKNRLWSELQLVDFSCPVRPQTNQTTSTKTLTVTEGNDAKFDCKLFADPMPTVFWTKDGRRIFLKENDTKYVTYSDGGDRFTNTLVVRNVDLPDAGEYRCYAENLSGRAQILFHMQVLPLPMVASPQTATKFSWGIGPIIGLVLAGFIVLLLFVVLIVFLLKRSFGKSGSFKTKSAAKKAEAANTNGNIYGANGYTPVNREEHELNSFDEDTKPTTVCLPDDSLDTTPRKPDYSGVKPDLICDECREVDQNVKMPMMGADQHFYPVNCIDPQIDPQVLYQHEDQQYYPTSPHYYPLTEQFYPNEMDPQYLDEPGPYYPPESGYGEPYYSEHPDDIYPHEIPLELHHAQNGLQPFQPIMLPPGANFANTHVKTAEPMHPENYGNYMEYPPPPGVGYFQDFQEGALPPPPDDLNDPNLLEEEPYGTNPQDEYRPMASPKQSRSHPLNLSQQQTPNGSQQTTPHGSQSPLNTQPASIPQSNSHNSITSRHSNHSNTSGQYRPPASQRKNSGSRSATPRKTPSPGMPPYLIRAPPSVTIKNNGSPKKTSIPVPIPVVPQVPPHNRPKTITEREQSPIPPQKPPRLYASSSDSRDSLNYRARSPRSPSTPTGQPNLTINPADLGTSV